LAFIIFCIQRNLGSDEEAEAPEVPEAPEAVLFWWKGKRSKICRFRFHSVLKLLFEF
jgi:hypothetical protein